MTRAHLQPFIDDRYISVQKHPTDDLFIYNYTEKVQFERYWTDETRQCRGLILDGQDRVVARPFPKFHNLEELGPEWQAPAEPFTVTQKLDGSLGILYQRPDGQLNIATRGSFISEQALHATEVFQARYAHLPWEADKYTYLFEIIFPANRIVVDYGELDDLILIAVLDTQTGNDVPLPAWFPNHVATYDGITDLASIRALGKDNEEGFVVRFQSGLRIKLKLPDYVRLHRLVTGVNARRIWDILANGGSIDELLERVPEEFETWVRATAAGLLADFARIDHETDHDLAECNRAGSRADFARDATTKANPGILFAKYDHKPYDHIIWKLIKPAAERPFKQADE